MSRICRRSGQRLERKRKGGVHLFSSMAAGMESSESEPRAPTRVTVAVCGPFDGHGSSINIRRIVYLPDPHQTPRLPTLTPRQFKQFIIQQTMSDQIYYRPYVGESDLPSIMALVQSELSEPYIIYTYRYFLQQWYVK